MATNKKSYYENLPKKRMAVGAVFLDAAQRILIVKPIYKDTWLIPGGVIEVNESPYAACIREVQEEIGLYMPHLKFLSVDYMSSETSGYPNKGENLQFIFFGGVLGEEEIKNIKLAKDEISEYKFASLAQAQQLVNKNLARRLPKSLEAIHNSGGFYLEAGESISDDFDAVH